MIAIPNIEKPKECDGCPLCGYDERQSILFCRLDNEDIVQDLRDDCPLIDIVTCGECEYYKESEYIKGNMVCKYHLGHTYYTEADRFCYYGKRRTDEHTD